VSTCACLLLLGTLSSPHLPCMGMGCSHEEMWHTVTTQFGRPPLHSVLLNKRNLLLMCSLCVLQPRAVRLHPVPTSRPTVQAGTKAVQAACLVPPAQQHVEQMPLALVTLRAAMTQTHGPSLGELARVRRGLLSLWH
jgi:hypothetical protein